MGKIEKFIANALMFVLLFIYWVPITLIVLWVASALGILNMITFGIYLIVSLGFYAQAIEEKPDYLM